MSMLKTQEAEVAKGRKQQQQEVEAAKSRKQQQEAEAAKSRKQQPNTVSDNLIQTKTEIRQYSYC